jgi:hypothetical protein
MAADVTVGPVIRLFESLNIGCIRIIGPTFTIPVNRPVLTPPVASQTVPVGNIRTSRAVDRIAKASVITATRIKNLGFIVYSFPYFSLKKRFFTMCGFYCFSPYVSPPLLFIESP